MHLPFETADIHTNNGEPTMSEGIWFGTNGGTGEASVGTEKGVVKRRTLKRLRANG